MSNSSGSESGDEQVDFLSSQVWKDVTPIPQDDGPNPICPINYSKQYSDAMGLFRFLTQTNETTTPRAEQLTKYLIKQNPAHYSIWIFRQAILSNIDNHVFVTFDQELEFLEELMEEHSKNYQLWHHRQWIIMQSPCSSNPEKELKFINHILFSIDSKNYHCWTYRQWVIQHFDLFDGELEECDSFILEDIRNNSAWNQRFFVNKYKMIKQGLTELDQVDVDREITYSLFKISLAPRNESVWNYIRGIIKLSGKCINDFEAVRSVCLDYFSKGIILTHCYSFLLDVFEADINESKNHNEDLVVQCERICDLLMDYDHVRKKYWSYRKESIPKK